MIVRGRRPLRSTQLLDVPYVVGGHVEQKLDFYYPSTGGIPYRCCIVVHPGGWQQGDKALPGTSHIFAELKTSDICMVSINYRLAGDAVWPAQIYDVKAAVRFMRANATAYGINPHRIGIWGLSAGGHLAGLVAATGTGTLTDTSLGNASTSEHVTLCVCGQTPSYFPEEDADFASQATPNGRGYNICSTSSEEAELFGGIGTGVNPCSGSGLTKSDEANIRAYLGADSCPTWLIEHGDEDPTIPYKQGEHLHDAIVAAGLNSTWRLAAGKGHSGADWNGDSAVRAATVAWISANL